jgi:DNA-directed RNA polymerase beta subunit
MGFAWAATVGGKLPLGKIILVAYMPSKGYNFEDAIVLISEYLVFLEIYSSFRIIKYETRKDTTSQGSIEKSLKTYKI